MHGYNTTVSRGSQALLYIVVLCHQVNIDLSFWLDTLNVVLYIC